MGEMLGGVKNTSDGNITQTDLTKIIEAIQFIKASWFNDLGLQANYNMKRESLSESEVALNEDVMLPLVDNMLEMRRIHFDKVNQKFGTKISVELNSSWLNTRKSVNLGIEAMEKEVKTDKEEVHSGGQEEKDDKGSEDVETDNKD